ncbi:UNVERIFIED_ORG: hypothetical protein GGD51_005496 [Rhizobium esperanzae]|uniref:hypothetical protein n=1 Tax=Rhizobium phaseoli TaxID=396 RepID=UPI0011AEB13A|nr:hypothetical protein [Rhizobium phaseoli]
MNISQGSQNREKADSRKKFGRPTQNAHHAAAPLSKRSKEPAALLMMLSERRDTVFNLYRLQSPAISANFRSDTQSRK